MRKNYQNESGRSMVEMLGVLAVIGVLSVAGIAGYSRAMDKHKANTIINEAQKRATMVVPQIQMMNNSTPTLNEFVNNDLGYATFDKIVYTNSNLPALPAGQFGIKISGVSKNICQNIHNLIGSSTSIRWIVPVSNVSTTMTASDCQEMNDLILGYNNDFSINDANASAKSCTQTSECGYCKSCIRGKCMPSEVCDNYCPGNRPVLTSDGSCIACPSVEKGERLEFSADDESECAKCGFPIYDGVCRQNVCPEGYWLSYWNTCMNCNEWWTGAWKTCEASCPNRTQTGTSGSSYGQCKLKTRECLSGEGRDSRGSCYPCEAEQLAASSLSDCTCPNRDWVKIGSEELCIPICPNGWTRLNERCCHDDDIFIQQGTGTLRGGKYGICCPKTRPNWDGNKCNP